jgi:acetyl-CoA carboxylase carboxyltransferase component
MRRTTRRTSAWPGARLPADGVVAGNGYVGDGQVAVFSQDFSVVAGTLGRMQAEKITRIMHHALKVGVPVVAFKDSGGARIQEGVDALSGYGDVFYANVLLSGVVPQIAVICGPCAGGAAYSPALMDFVIMTREQRAHVPHRPRGDQGGDRPGDNDGRGRRRRDAFDGQRQRALRRRGRPPTPLRW